MWVPPCCACTPPTRSACEMNYRVSLSYRQGTLGRMFEQTDTVLLGGPPARTPYPPDMPVSAHDVAAVLRKRLPGVGIKKLHNLLYYCQGHHLATLGEALFGETVSAWDMGPVVGTLWKAERDGDAPPVDPHLGEAELNTIGYVISR